jgi:hypothetical protein
MPVIKNRKREKFAQALHQGHSQIEAYKLAGFKPHRSNASKLALQEEIGDRLAELARVQEQKVAAATEKAVEKLSISVEGLILEADAIQRGAIAAQQFSAATTTLIAKAKLAGLWVERAHNENANVNYIISDQPLTEDEWAAQHVTDD